MPDTLHTLLVSSLTARLERARAATPGPWDHVDFAEPKGQPMTEHGERSTFMGCGSVITVNEHLVGGDIAAPSGDLYPRSGYSPKEDMAFIAANDPATEIRRVEALLRVVERHAPNPQKDCRWCADPWPCSDLWDLAFGEGIEVET